MEQEEDLLHGTAESRGEVGGRIVFEIFSAFVGAEAVKALKGGEAAAKTADTIGDVSGALSKTEKIADEIADVSKAADKAADVSKVADEIADASKAADKAADVSKVADEIADASKTADKISDTAELAEDAGKVADKVAEGGTTTLSGQWRTVNENMSDFSSAYQKQITGQERMAWVQNGVKFDRMKDGVLLDAKGKYAQFIDKSTGEFYEWFSGKDSLIAEARRQIAASEGAKIQWYFAEEESLNVVQDLLMDKGITEIELIFELPK